MTSARPYLPATNVTWERRKPADLGVEAARLQRAVDYALSHEIDWPYDLALRVITSDKPPYDKNLGPVKPRGAPAGLVVKDGYIIAEWGDLDRVDLTFSATKSYVATIAGLAFDRGMIRDPHDRVAEYVHDGGFDSPHNSQITWHHLLQQTNEWEGTLFGIPDTADWDHPIEGKSPEANRTRHAPGTFWQYNDVRVNRTALALLRVWNEPLPQVLKREVMDPIGASDTWVWHGYGKHSMVDLNGRQVESVSGGAHWGGGLWINTYDHARFGLLYLNRGCWGERRIISEAWIDRMTVPCDLNPAYGYMWWLNTGHLRYGRHASEKTFAASGAGGNSVVILPEHNAVVVTRWCIDVPAVVDRVAAALGR